MLLISLARHSSSMPMLSNAFQRQRETQQCGSVARRIDALASLCTCFFAPRFSAPMHVLWPLIPRSAGHTPAIPQHVLASHRQGVSPLRHSKSPQLFSIAEHSLAAAKHSRSAADRSCSAVYRSFALASQCSSELFHCASRLCTAHSAAPISAVPSFVCSMHIDAIPRPFASLPCRRWS